MIGRVETLRHDLEYISQVNNLEFITSREDKFKVNISYILTSQNVPRRQGKAKVMVKKYPSQQIFWP